MNDAFNADVAGKLNQLFFRLDRLEKCLNNLLIPGKVSDISNDNKKVKVTHGSCITPFIKWFAHSAGGVIEYRKPSVGEQCLLLNLTGGQDTSICWALVGIDSEQFPFHDVIPTEHVRKYPDGTEISYDHSAHLLKVIMNSGEAEFDIPDKITMKTSLLHCTGSIKSDKDITDKTRSMDGDRSIYNDHAHPHGDPNTKEPIQKQ